ncbi:uncharacterized protein [Amphiura filiformis]|uniref:uncharacterized protein n=1 Tax=Amphiura filiformis TaxID=82378 RepID=UPI003B21A649
MMRGICILVLGLFLFWNKATTNAQTDSQQPLSCNSCCQGPAGSQGTPGIPGVPGTNGIPGNVGPRGERGESITGEAGPRGEKGDTGNPALKGESGMAGVRGPPGKVGPAGIAGTVGLSGTSGVKGQKGEMGRSRLSAFSAVRRTSFTPSSNSEALPFEQVHTNVGGDFVASSGRFTCDIPGIYLFTYSIATRSHGPRVHLMKNAESINSVHRSVEGGTDIVSNTGVLQLATGDVVWLKCSTPGQLVYTTASLYTTFSGVILHEI